MKKALEKPVTFCPSKNTDLKIDYNELEGLVDAEHNYDIFWHGIDDKDGMNSGREENLTKDELLSRINSLKKFDCFLGIKPKTLRLGRVRHDKEIGFAHSDERRIIYEPQKILTGLEGIWHNSNIIVIKESNLFLGKHHHNYDEAFFVPVGNFKFSLADSKEPNNPRNYKVSAGERILIPAYIDHILVGKKDSVLIGYGTMPFTTESIIKSDKKVLETLFEEIKAN